MSFSRVLDQPVAVGLLGNMIRRGRYPHALLFAGPEGVGKQLTAVEVAKALNCEAPGHDGGCDQCHTCDLIERGKYPDLLHVSPMGASNQITLRDAKNNPTIFMNYCELAAYRPSMGKKRIILIHEAHRMSDRAQTQFLKTLEEPAGQTAFILLSHNPRELMATVRSRCQSVRFGTLQPKTVADIVMRVTDLNRAEADAVAVAAQGQVARAINFATTEKRQVVLDITRRLSEGEDPLLLSQGFSDHLKGVGEELKEGVEKEMGSREEERDMTSEERQKREEEIKARITGLIRAEIAEYIYLFQTVYRDRMAYEKTGNTNHLFNRDHADEMRLPCPPEALVAIEKAWRYLQRYIKSDRVFRDLFFTLST